jgi:hypothetical protein
LTFSFFLFPFLFLQSPGEPVIVKIYETPHDPTGLADVLLAALGLTGVLIVLAVLAAGAFAGALYWLRSRTD